MVLNNLRFFYFNLEMGILERKARIDMQQKSHSGILFSLYTLDVHVQTVGDQFSSLPNMFGYYSLWTNTCFTPSSPELSHVTQGLPVYDSTSQVWKYRKKVRKSPLVFCRHSAVLRSPSAPSHHWLTRQGVPKDHLEGLSDRLLGHLWSLGFTKSKWGLSLCIFKHPLLVCF